MAFVNPDDHQIRAILSRTMTIAVVGCSPSPERASHRVARFLQRRGHRIVPIHPATETVLGETAYPSVLDVPPAVQIDMMDVFRRPAFLRQHVEEAIARGIPIVWAQLDVVDEEAARLALDAGLQVVMNRCPAIEYRRLF